MNNSTKTEESEHFPGSLRRNVGNQFVWLLPLHKAPGKSTLRVHCGSVSRFSYTLGSDRTAHWSISITCCKDSKSPLWGWWYPILQMGKLRGREQKSYPRTWSQSCKHSGNIYPEGPDSQSSLTLIQCYLPYSGQQQEPSGHRPANGQFCLLPLRSHFPGLYSSWYFGVWL